jgi:hypothetical protein
MSTVANTTVKFLHISLHLEFQGVFPVACLSHAKISERSALPQRAGRAGGRAGLLPIQRAGLCPASRTAKVAAYPHFAVGKQGVVCL